LTTKKSKGLSFGFGHSETSGKMEGFVSSRASPTSDFSYKKVTLNPEKSIKIKYQSGYLITVILVSGKVKIYSGRGVEVIHKFSANRNFSGMKGLDVVVFNPIKEDSNIYVILSKIEQ